MNELKKKLGNIEVLKITDFKEGLIIELSESELPILSIRRYYIVNGDKMSQNVGELELTDFNGIKSEWKAAMKIRKQIRSFGFTEKIYIDEGAEELLKDIINL